MVIDRMVIAKAISMFIDYMVIMVNSRVIDPIVIMVIDIMVIVVSDVWLLWSMV